MIPVAESKILCNRYPQYDTLTVTAKPKAGEVLWIPYEMPIHQGYSRAFTIIQSVSGTGSGTADCQLSGEAWSGNIRVQGGTIDSDLTIVLKCLYI